MRANAQESLSSQPTQKLQAELRRVPGLVDLRGSPSLGDIASAVSILFTSALIRGEYRRSVYKRPPDSQRHIG